MQDNIDILSADLSSVDVSRPMLAAGVVELVVSDLKVEPNKDGTKQNLNMVLKTTSNERSSRGDTLSPGFTLFHTVSLTPTEKYTAERIGQSLKGIRLAATGESGGTFAPIDQYIGKTLTAKVYVEEDKNGVYPAQNRIKSFVAKD